jgi:hypothetical protein
VNILLLASHAVAEYDDLRMFTDLGYDCFAPGGYEVPSRSGEGIRPPLPDAPHHPEFVELCERRRADNGEPGAAIDWAKAMIPDKVIEWADAIIVHHFPVQWIGGQWSRIKHKRVIWRTCGQSDPNLEGLMAGFVGEGLQVVRYSPAERRHFEKVGQFAGEDALIRFGKYPADYGPWDGDEGKPSYVANVTQDMVMRGEACGLQYYLAATDGLRAMPAGKGSELLPGGIGHLSYQGMIAYLRFARAYIYTGTRPASYTLGLLEANLSGVPTVVIGRRAWGGEWGGEDLWDMWGADVGDKLDDPTYARKLLKVYLDDPELARLAGDRARRDCIAQHDVAVVGQQWREFLS